MDNFEHEIACPDNKEIKKFLWSDHFHDSTPVDIAFDRWSREVVFTLDCCRDKEEIWGNFKGNDDNYHEYIDSNKDKFIYYLTFKGIRYFHVERLMDCSDYINGRFKDSALLRKLQAEQSKSLYHFRIQFADGYGDLIFSDFKIRKKQGRVNYASDDVLWQTERIIPLDVLAEKNIANTGEDFDRVLAMEKLYQVRDKSLLEIARENFVISVDCEDSLFYSAYLLGKLGDKSDIPKLLELYFGIEDFLMLEETCRCDATLPKRNILDAIEDIEYREREAAEASPRPTIT